MRTNTAKKKCASAKRKIQIRSFVKGGNHGQYLQALGLRELVKSIIPDSEVSHLNYTNHFLKELIIQTRGFHLPKYIAMLYYWYKRFKFSSFEISPDISVYGSDMIWHQESDLFPPDPVFFGGRDSCPKKVAFAPSVAFRGDSEAVWIKKMLNSYSAIGVRDEGTGEFVCQYTGKTAECVIDPCFFLMQSKYSELIKSEKRSNFFSIYSTYPEGILKVFQTNLTRYKLPDYCFKHNYLGYFPQSDFFKELATQLSDPLWTVKRIAESKFLLTSTFHGVMMALMTRTPFIAVKSKNLTARLRSPIASCFSPNRLVSIQDLKDLNENSIQPLLKDDDLNQNQLINYMEQSQEWLKRTLLTK